MIFWVLLLEPRLYVFKFKIRIMSNKVWLNTRIWYNTSRYLNEGRLVTDAYFSIGRDAFDRRKFTEPGKTNAGEFFANILIAWGGGGLTELYSCCVM